VVPVGQGTGARSGDQPSTSDLATRAQSESVHECSVDSRNLMLLLETAGVEAQKCMCNRYFITANHGCSHLAAAELARDIDFPAKAATETLPISFQRSLFSDEI